MLEKKQETIQILNEHYQSFKTKEKDKKEKRVGIELEFIILPLNNQIPCFTQIKKIFQDYLTEQNFSPETYDLEGYCTKAVNFEKDRISFECSYSMVEFSFAPTSNLKLLKEKINKFIYSLEEKLSKYNLTLSSLGMHPYSWRTKIPMVRDPYYFMLSQVFKDYNIKKSYSFENGLSFIASSQIHLDIDYQDIYKMINILNAIGWVKSLLFANSLDFSQPNNFCVRDNVWEDSIFAFNTNNTGIENIVYSNSEEVLMNQLENLIFYVQRDSHYIYFEPMSLKKFYSLNKINGWKIIGDKKTQTNFSPMNSDIQYCRPCHYASITKAGTIEVKSECQQPFSDLILPAAFHLGLMNNLNEIYDFIQNSKFLFLNHDFRNLRKKANTLGYQLFSKSNINIIQWIKELLLLIEKGVNEVEYLNPLWERISNESNPAITIYNQIQNNSHKDWIINSYNLSSHLERS